MKKQFLILLVLLFIGNAYASENRIYKEIKKGEWATFDMDLGSGVKLKQRILYLGEHLLNHQKAYGVETDVVMSGPMNMSLISQSWYSIDDDKLIKTVSQMGGMLMCSSAAAMGQEESESVSLSLKTLKSYSKDVKPLKTDIFVSKKNDKKIDANVYKIVKDDPLSKKTSGTIWLSSVVPFGILKVVEKQKTILVLEDYGKDAKPKILIEKALSCKPQF